jgi:hypothetical protein
VTVNNGILAMPRYGLVSVDQGRLVDDLSIKETFSTEREAYAAAESYCTDMAGSEMPLQVGEGFWIVEIRPVRFVGRS